MALSLAMLFAAAHPAQEAPLPEGHRPLGPPSREDVLEGWETFIGDIPPSAGCENIGQPMVQPLNPPFREEGVNLLADTIVRDLSEAEAARLIEVQGRDTEPLATTVFAVHLEEMRARKHRAEVERRDSWSLADQQELEKLIARFETGDHRRYRPYLVRAVSKFGDGHGGPPFMFGDLCGDDLHLPTLVFSYTIPPSVRVPAVVFLPRLPKRVIATVRVAR